MPRKQLLLLLLLLAGGTAQPMNSQKSSVWRSIEPKDILKWKKAALVPDDAAKPKLYLIGRLNAAKSLDLYCLMMDTEKLDTEEGKGTLQLSLVTLEDSTDIGSRRLSSPTAVHVMFVEGSSEKVATFRSSMHDFLSADTLKDLLVSLKEENWEDPRLLTTYCVQSSASEPFVSLGPMMHVYASSVGRGKDPCNKDLLDGFLADVLERMKVIAGESNLKVLT